MKKHIYWNKQGKFESDEFWGIPWDDLHSPNENTPALIYPNGIKVWWFEGTRHRLTGPAIIRINGNFNFYLYGTRYEVNDWLQNHPNQDETFQAIMKLRYS